MQKKIVFFRRALTQEGGAERLLFEVASRAKDLGLESHIIVLSGGDTAKLFDGRFSNLTVQMLNHLEHPSGFFSKILFFMSTSLKLRKAIQAVDPDYIHAQESYDAEFLYLATLWTKYSYSTFVHQTFFWAEEELLKYFFPFRRHFKEIRDAVAGHKQFISEKTPPLSVFVRIALCLRAILNYIAVRKATAIVVPSDVMGREVGQLYGKKSATLKMGIDEKMFDYHPRKDMKKKLGLEGKTMIIEVSRLAPQKRLDLAIRAFGALSSEFPEAVFVIGGRGSERERLENLIDKLNLAGKVILLGFVSENDLLDLYASSDLAFHPAWIDFDISFMEPLALGKKIVCSTEYDLIDNLLKLKGELIFPAAPTVSEMSAALKRALLHRPQEQSMRKLLSDYTWGNYTKHLMVYLQKNNHGK